MNENDVRNHFAGLWNDLDEREEFYNKKPHLAHYTSISGAEKILQSNELWFSNPLYMNDHEEVKFGVNEGFNVAVQSTEIANAIGSAERFANFKQVFGSYYRQFALDHALDTYVFCFSEIAKDDNDGRLSMWRGYGGSGSGAAIAIDASKISPVDSSAFVLARVHYGTANARVDYLRKLVGRFVDLLRTARLQDDQLPIAAAALFERIKLFALFTKHVGFEEEHEWRILYTPTRDPAGRLKNSLGYSVGARGVEPRLKFRIVSTEGVTTNDFTFDNIIDRILLGPTLSSPLALAGFKRLLDGTGHKALKDRVRTSAIPFRERL